jgi:rSAM/selenodomain-associated transferase 1
MAMRADRASARRLAVHLIVMSRAPLPGRTKTRLIPAFGAEGAAAFHAACLADILSEAEAWRQAGPAQGQARGLTLCVTPPESWPAFARAGIVFPAGAALTFQQGDTLGARMAHALHEALAGTGPGSGAQTHPAAGAAALLVGSDVPLLSRSHLEAAVARLADAEKPADIVLGPAEDGGYYLIGVGAGGRWPELFTLEDWGGDTVLQRTLAAAARIGLRVAQLDVLPDADTPEDLARNLAHPLAEPKRLSLALARRLLGAP